MSFFFPIQSYTSIHGSLWTRSSASGHCTPHCDVHGQLDAVVHRRSQDLNRSFVGGRDAEVHITQLGVDLHWAVRFTTHAGQDAFHGHGPWTKSVGSGTCRSVLDSDVQGLSTFAHRLRDHQWEAHPFQHDSSENVRFQFELCWCWISTQHQTCAKTRMRPQMSLACSTWLGKHYRLHYIIIFSFSQLNRSTEISIGDTYIKCVHKFFNETIFSWLVE